MDEATFHVQQLFFQGSYGACIESGTDSQDPLVALYVARAYIALGETTEAVELLSSRDDTAARSVCLLAEHVEGTTEGEEAINEAKGLLEESDSEDEGILKALVATIYIREGLTSDALPLLTMGAQEQSSDCVALQIQLLLAMDRLDLAKRAYEQAKLWAEDSLIIQLCEAWIGLRTGGDAYQSAYYVYDEIAQMPNANNAIVLNGKAIAQAAMGHWPEADAALTEAKGLDNDNATTLANEVALASVLGKSNATAEEVYEKLQKSAPQHPLVVNLTAKASLFDEVASKFGLVSA